MVAADRARAPFATVASNCIIPCASVSSASFCSLNAVFTHLTCHHSSFSLGDSDNCEYMHRHRSEAVRCTTQTWARGRTNSNPCEQLKFMPLLRMPDNPNNNCYSCMGRTSGSGHGIWGDDGRGGGVVCFIDVLNIHYVHVDPEWAYVTPGASAGRVQGRAKLRAVRVAMVGWRPPKRGW